MAQNDPEVIIECPNTKRANTKLVKIIHDLKGCIKKCSISLNCRVGMKFVLNIKDKICVNVGLGMHIEYITAIHYIGMERCPPHQPSRPARNIKE